MSEETQPDGAFKYSEITDSVDIQCRDRELWRGWGGVCIAAQVPRPGVEPWMLRSCGVRFNH